MNNHLLQINAERDLAEILKLIEEYLRRTYIKDVEREMIRCREKCEHRPTKEIELLLAIEPFIKDDKKKNCEEIIKVLRYEQIIREMMPVFFSKDIMRENRQEDPIRTLMIKLLMYKMLDTLEKK